MNLYVINGSSTSGKSTVTKEILDNNSDYFRLSYDEVKRFFSKYDRETHYKDVIKVWWSIAESVIDLKYNIVSEGGLFKDRRD